MFNVKDKLRAALYPVAMVGACSGLVLTNVAQADSVADEIQALKDRLAKLEQKQKATPKIEVGAGGVKFHDKKTGAKLRIGGRFHLDANSYDGAFNAKNGGVSGSDVFVRRARLEVKGSLDNWVYGGTFDFSDTGTNSEPGDLLTANLAYTGFAKNGGPVIKVGKLKEVGGLAWATSSNHITAMSRPMITNATHGSFNWGGQISQHFKDTGLSYWLHVTQNENGSNKGQNANTAATLAYTGRVTWAPIAEAGKVLHLGAWATHRDQGGNSFRNRARPEVNKAAVRLLDSRAGGADPLVDSVTTYGVELASVMGPVSLQGEYIKRETDSLTQGDPDLDGYYVMATWSPSGLERKYKAKNGAFYQPKNAKGWELFARYGSADATFKNNSGVTQGTEVDVWSVGVNYYVNKNVRFMLNYINAEVDGSDAALSGLLGAANVGEDSGQGITFRTHYMF